MSARPEKIDLLSLLFDSAFDLELNIAPNLTPLRGARTDSHLGKQTQARTPGLFSALALARGLGMRLSGAMFNSRSNALCDPMFKKSPFGTGTSVV